MKKDNLSVVVVAAGSGRRMGGELPKQYMELEGKPIVVRTMEALYEGLSSLVAEVQYIWVYPQGDKGYVGELRAKYLPEAMDLVMVEGGATRGESVAHGLEEVRYDYVMIHDGVRPFVSSQLLKRICDKREEGCVVPALPATDSVRLDFALLNTAFPREQVLLVQTPQLIERELIMASYQLFLKSPNESTIDAYGHVADPSRVCTDDASVANIYGNATVTIVEGEEQNIKITTPKDMVLAKWYMAQLSEQRLDKEL